MVIRARPIASICCSPPTACRRLAPRSAKPREQLEDAVEVGLQLALVGPRVGTHLEVLEDRHPAEDPASLGRVGDAPMDELVGRHVSDVVAVEGDRSRARVDQAADRAQGRRLAGAVAAEERHDLARVDLQGDPLQGVDVHVEGMDVVQPQERPVALPVGKRGGGGRGGHALAPFPR